MSLFFTNERVIGQSAPQSNTNTQSRLLLLAALFVAVYALALTISPAARARSWAVPLRWDHWLAFASWLVVFSLLHRTLRRVLPNHDPYLLPAAAFLSGWGLLTIFRLQPAFGLRQSLWLLVGGLIFFFGLRLPASLTHLRRYKYVWLTAGLGLTALTFFAGTNPLGAGPELWLGCCGIYLQPSEPLKLLLVVYLAAYFADHVSPGPVEWQRSSFRDWLSLLAPALLVGAIALSLLVAQRDLGTAAVILFLFSVLIYLATRQRWFILLSMAFLIAASILGYTLYDVVRLRVDAWLNPWLDPSGRSFQIVQSLLAIANGGIFGRGPGLGSPGLVPVAHSDFIFAAIAEEAGLAGVMALFILLALAAQRGLWIALRARNNFHRLLSAGLSAYLAGQSILIIGGNTRLLPLTGVTLPFVSYGGSSLVTSFVSLLLLLQISSQLEERPYPLASYRPYLGIVAMIFTGLFSLALVSGWWSAVRGPDLLLRNDNQRRSIADRYVHRGSLLDRENNPLNESIGPTGEMQRRYLFPALSPILGYTHPIYGQSGLEQSLDDYLRGLRGQPGLTIWWAHILFGQPPPGLDVRLSLDGDLQRFADGQIGGHVGAAVLLDALSGEILLMSSRPTFDANRLDETWPALIQDPASPLLNRATQGSYQPGTALGAMWLGALNNANLALPEQAGQLSQRLNGSFFSCAIPPQNETSLITALQGGCPGASLAVTRELLAANPDSLRSALVGFGLYTTPATHLPVVEASTLLDSGEDVTLILGQSDLKVSPLQMALAAASLTADGVRPAPRITNSVNTPAGGWVVLPALGTPSTALTAAAAARTIEALAVDGVPYWELVGSSQNGSQRMIWYLAGTLPDWSGSPLALALILEEDNPRLARQIGRGILHEALSLP